MSWELWKHPDPVPGVRPMFFKPKLHKESKNGFKTIPDATQYYLFQKTIFRQKKMSKNIFNIAIKIQKSTKHSIFLLIVCTKKQFFEKIING